MTTPTPGPILWSDARTGKRMVKEGLLPELVPPNAGRHHKRHPLLPDRYGTDILPAGDGITEAGMAQAKVGPAAGWHWR